MLLYFRWQSSTVLTPNVTRLYFSHHAPSGSQNGKLVLGMVLGITYVGCHRCSRRKVEKAIFHRIESFSRNGVFLPGEPGPGGGHGLQLKRNMGSM